MNYVKVLKFVESERVFFLSEHNVVYVCIIVKIEGSTAETSSSVKQILKVDDKKMNKLLNKNFLMAYLLKTRIKIELKLEKQFKVSFNTDKNFCIRALPRAPSSGNRKKIN